MNQKAAMALILGFVIFAGAASAASIEELVAQAKAQHEARKTEIKDLTVTRVSTMHSPRGDQSSTVVTMTKGEKFRSESTMKLPENPNIPAGMGAMTTISLFDGTDHWTISSSGKQKLPAGAGASSQSDDADGATKLLEGATLAGEETVLERDCWVVVPSQQVKVTKFAKVWLDKQDLSLVRGEGDDKGHTMRLDNSDFRAVAADYRIPYHTELYRDGKSAGTMIVSDVKVNQELSDDEFNAEKIALPSGPSMQDLMKMKQEQGK